MPVDVWPATLPQGLQRTDYAEGIGDGRLRSQMDAGPAKVRRRSSAMPRPLTGTMVVTSAQIQTVRQFIEETLIGGSLPFCMPAPRTGGPILVRLVEMPSWSALGGKWYRLNLSLEVLP